MLVYEILKEIRYWVKVIALGQHTVFNPLVVQDKTANNRKQFFNSIAYLDERSNHQLIRQRDCIRVSDEARYLFHMLNDDLLLLIFEYLDFRSLIRASEVCAVMYHVSHHNVLWIQWLDLERSLFGTRNRQQQQQQPLQPRLPQLLQLQRQRQQHQGPPPPPLDSENGAVDNRIEMEDFQRKYEKLCKFYKPTREVALYYQFRILQSNSAAQNAVEHETNLTSWIQQHNVNQTSHESLATEAINIEDTDDTIDNLDFDDVVHDTHYGDEEEEGEDLELDQIRIRHSRGDTNRNMFPTSSPLITELNRRPQQTPSHTPAERSHIQSDVNSSQPPRDLHLQDNLTTTAISLKDPSANASETSDIPANSKSKGSLLIVHRNNSNNGDDNDDSIAIKKDTRHGGVSGDPSSAPDHLLINDSGGNGDNNSNSSGYIYNPDGHLIRHSFPSSPIREDNGSAEEDNVQRRQSWEPIVLSQISREEPTQTENFDVNVLGDFPPLTHRNHGRQRSDLPLLFNGQSEEDEDKENDGIDNNKDADIELRYHHVHNDNEVDIQIEIGNEKDIAMDTCISSSSRVMQRTAFKKQTSSQRGNTSPFDEVRDNFARPSEDDNSTGDHDLPMGYSLNMAETEMANYMRRKEEYHKAYAFFRRRKLRNPYIRSRLMKAYVLEQKRKYHPITKWINHGKFVAFSCFFLTTFLTALRFDKFLLFPLAIITFPLLIGGAISFVLSVLLWTPTLSWPLALYRAVGKGYVGCWVSWAYILSARGRFVQLIFGLMLTAVPSMLFFMFVFPNFIPPWAPMVIIVVAFIVWSYTATQVIYTPAKGLYSLVLLSICFLMSLFAIFVVIKLLFEDVFRVYWSLVFTPLILLSLPIFIGHVKLTIQLGSATSRHGVCVVWNLLFIGMQSLLVSTLIMLILALDRFVSAIPYTLVMCPLFFVEFVMTVYYFMRAFYPSIIRQHAFKNPFTVLISGGVKNNSDMESFIV